MFLLTPRRSRFDNTKALKCVLLVEDDTNDALIACREFHKLNLKNSVFRVSTFKEMTAYLRREGEYSDREKYPAPAVIVVDMRLPGSDGLQVQAWLRSNLNFRQIPLILISSNENLIALKTAVELGADAWMTKPFRAEEFQRIAKRLHLDVEFEAERMESDDVCLAK
jgi:DNA-binding response OmpR family regulator